ncbi:MAG: amidohydrolase family protein, partial [Rhodothermia bacterium]|nr:amidohydrolase family protein [Rhodothermia bacterium]
VRTRLFVLHIGIVTLALGCTSDREIARFDLVVRGGNVIDVASGATLRDHDIWIVDDRIDSITPGGEKRVPPGTKTIDVRGHYVVPGLVDAHVHLDHVGELELYTALGVTTVFNMRGLPRHLEWRDAIERGELDGPTIYTAGDYMDGYPPYMQPLMSFDNPEEAAISVREQRDAGYDMVKVYTRLTLEQLEAITATADEVGLPVVGHGSGNYSLEELVAAGQLNVAHSQDLLRWYVDENYDPAQLAQIVATLGASSTTVTANLSWTAGLIRQAEDLEGLVAEPVARSLPPAILQPFRRANNRYVRRGIDWLPDVKARLEVQNGLIRDLHAAGVPLLAGSDASTSGVLPGTSLILEIELLVDAGLSPLDALRAATLAPGRFVDAYVDPDARFGKIAEGYRADLLVLAADPLEDVSRLGDAVGVIVRGRWLDRENLDARLAALEQMSRDLTPRVIEIEDGIKSGDLVTARRAFDDARALEPGAILFSQYVPFFIGYGYLYGEEGYSTDPESLEAALTLYKMYVETYPSFHSAHYMLALAHEANGDIEGAIESLEASLAIHPYSPDARQKLGELTSTTGE